MDAEWTYRLAEPGDAQAVLGLIERCYAGSYPELRGGPAALAARLEAGEIAYALAFDPQGELAGQVALEARSPSLWEHGRAIVAPAARGKRLLAAMSRVLFEVWAPRHDVSFVFGRSVTNHLRTQRYNEQAGFARLGLLLGVWAPTLQVLGVPRAEQPISALLVGLSLAAAPRPRVLALGGVEQARAAEVLDALRIPLDHATRVRSSGPLAVTRGVEQDGRLVHLRLGARPGPSTGPRGQPRSLERDLVSRAAAAGAGLVWADVPAEHPGARDAIARLREQGLSWGAYLPHGGLDGEDVVRLQRYLDPRPLLPEAVRVTERSQALRRDVFAEAVLSAPALQAAS